MFTEDPTAFYNTAEHAETALVGATSVDGNFDEPWHDDVQIGSTQPRFTTWAAWLPVGYKTATITLRGRNFKVAGVPNFDETGNHVTLELQEQ